MSGYGGDRGDKDITKAKNALDQGPISMAFEVYRDLMQYKTGIYRPSGGAVAGHHAVVCIGYGPGYIECVNSWGEKWGDKGLFKIQEGCCGMQFYVPAAMQIDKSAFPVPSGGKDVNFRRRTAPAPRPPSPVPPPSPPPRPRPGGG